jgi:hypothetical protein
LYSSYCSIFCFLCSVLYITVCPFISFALTMMLSVFCQFLFVRDIVCLLSVSLWPWYCLSFVSFPLAMLLSVFFSFPLATMLSVVYDVRLLATTLISSNLSCTLTKLSYVRYLFSKVSTNGIYFPTIYAFIVY